MLSYKAFDADGNRRAGQLPAQTVEELAARLSARGLELIACRPVRPGLVSRPAATRRDLIQFCFQLEQLIGAGVPLLDALIDLRDSLENAAFRDLIAGVIERIGNGCSFSAALAESPAVFDPLFTHLVHAGEQSGQLPEVLRDLTDGLKWQDELAARTRKALTYPGFTAVVIVAVALFLMVYLVPQLARFIAAMQGTLPLHTRALLALSGFLSAWWGLLLAAPGALLGVLLAARRNASVALHLDQYKLRLWLIGDIVRKVELARFARLFSLMYRAGIPVLEILRLASEAVRNSAIRCALAEAREAVSDGERVTHAFTRSGLFPPLVLRMIATGETTGGLDVALANVSYFYDRDVRERIERLEAMIGPALTITLGLLLGWIMLAVLGPLYDLIGRMRL